MLIRLRIATTLLALVLSSAAIARTPAAVDPAVQLARDESERLRADAESQVARLKLEVESFMALQDKRIADLTYYANFNNGLIAFMGALVTAVVVALAFKSKEDARAAVREWLDKEAKTELTKEFEAFRVRVEQQATATLTQLFADIDKKLEQRAEERLASIDEKASPFLARLEKSSAKFESMEEFLEPRDMARSPNEPAGSLSDIVSDPVKLRVAAAEAMAVSEGERTFNDWFLLASAAVEEKEDVAALNRFAKARAAGTTDRLLALKAAYHGALAAYRLERWDEAAMLFRSTTEQWEKGDVRDAELLAIDSYLRRCMALFKIERRQDALDAVDEALAKDWDTNNRSIAKRAESLRFKRGVALHHLKRDAEAEAEYDNFIRRHEDTGDDYLKGEYASALLNKMILRRKAKDMAEAKRLFQELNTRCGALADQETIANVLARARELWPEAEAKVVEATG